MEWPPVMPPIEPGLGRIPGSSRLGTKIVTDRVSPARVRHLPQVAPRRNLPAGLGRPRGLRRGSAYGSFPAVHQPRRNLSLWLGSLLFTSSFFRLVCSAPISHKIYYTTADC